MADSAPINEVRAAACAGLGLQGDNGMLINEKYGGYVFIGAIYTDAVFEYGGDKTSSCIHCGKCGEACPMKNGRDCLSAVTQKKGDLTEGKKEYILEYGSAWGCDICADVCPYSQRAVKNNVFTPIRFFYEDRTPYLTVDTLDKMTDEQFAERAYAWRGKAVVERNLSLLQNDKQQISIGIDFFNAQNCMLNECFDCSMEVGPFRDQSKRQYQSTYNTNVRNSIGRMAVSDIKRDHICRFLADLLKKRARSRDNVNSILVTIRCALDFASKNDLIARNPCPTLNEILKYDNIKKTNLKAYIRDACIQKRKGSEYGKRSLGTQAYIDHDGRLYGYRCERDKRQAGGIRKRSDLSGRQTEWTHRQARRSVIFKQTKSSPKKS